MNLLAAGRKSQIDPSLEAGAAELPVMFGEERMHWVRFDYRACTVHMADPRIAMTEKIFLGQKMGPVIVSLALSATTTSAHVIHHRGCNAIHHPPPQVAGRIAVPAIYYSDISLTKVISTYDLEFTHNRFFIRAKKTKRIKNYYDPNEAIKLITRTYSLRLTKPACHAEVTYRFQYYGGPPKTPTVRVSLTNGVAFCYRQGKMVRETIIREDLYAAKKHAQIEIDKSIGSHQLHEFDPPNW